MQRIAFVLLVAVTAAAADIVMTTKEVIPCQIVDADSVAVRLKMESGGIRMLSVKDLYEIRVADQQKADWLAVVLPTTKVVVDADADEIGQEVITRPASLESASPKLDPVGSGHVMLAGQVGVSGVSVGETSTTTFTFSPSLTYFVARSIGIGLDIAVTSAASGASSMSTAALGPKVTGALGPRGGSGYFLAEAGFAFTGGSGRVGGDRTWFAVGYLPVVGSHLGLPLRLSILVDRIADVRMTTWQLGIGMSGLL